MAVADILLAIDRYITELKAARILLDRPLVPSEKKTTKATTPKKPQAQAEKKTTLARIHPVDVPIHVIPPRNPRQRNTRPKPISFISPALAGSAPRNPVVVRPADMARIHREAGEIDPPKRLMQSSQPKNPLEELASEVARRINVNHGSRF